MVDFDTSVQTIYQHTADARGERATLNLVHNTSFFFRKDEDGTKVPYFDGAIYEELS